MIFKIIFIVQLTLFPITLQQGDCFQRKNQVILNDCAQECLKFDDLDTALNQCRSDKFCKGVSLSNQDFNIFQFTFFPAQKLTFQLRSGDELNTPNLDLFSMIKTRNCPFIERCKYTKSNLGTSEGCVQGCKDFSTFEEARVACNLDENCQAITYTSSKLGGQGSRGAKGNGKGFQLRSNKSLQKNNNGITWFKSCQQVCGPQI